MGQRETEFLQRLRATFLVEAREHLQTVATGLLALERAASIGERGQQLELVFRHTHSLKGAARAANFARIEAVCQAAEAVFAMCKRRGRILGAADFDTLHRGFDFVAACVDAGGTTPAGSSSEASDAIIRQIQALVAGEAAAGHGPHHPASTGEAGDAVVRDRGSSTPAGGTGHSDPRAATAEPPGEAAASIGATPAAAGMPAETVRVAAPRLDALLTAAEELLTVRQMAGERAAELQRLERGFDDWSKQWLAAQGALRRLRDLGGRLPPGTDPATVEAPAQALAFLEWSYGFVKSTEGRLRAMSRAAAGDQHLAGKQIEDLLDESKSLLMMPFTSAAEALPKLARDLARDQGKDVDMQLEGGDVQLDKRVLEQLKDPLVHLVRNAIDHGIETPGRRREAGKPERASLRIRARLVHGSNVEIDITDDGAGIDPDRLRKAAVNAGLLSADAAGQLDDTQALDLAFRSDVSTSPIITEISGRGLGLAIVREHVERLGGRIAVENRAPLGAHFHITLPQSLATFRGLFVQAGGQVFVIPTTHVERVARLPRSGLKTVSRRQTLPIDGQAVAVAALADLLELAGAPAYAAPDAEFITAVLIGSGHERLALAVEDVLHDEEVLVKRLQRPLVRVRNVAGATVLASGKVLPILNVADLLKSARRVGGVPRPATAQSADERPIARRVLVAEDSITSRLLIKGILESAGCAVKTAADGIEAFTALRSEPFDLLVSDIEMPRLNGFDLTARVRADRTLSELPVVLVTALATREDRERGIDVGANAYITKGGFDQRDLLEAVRRLVGPREHP